MRSAVLGMQGMYLPNTKLTTSPVYAMHDPSNTQNSNLLRVLCIDDSEIDVLLVVESLSSSGYEVVWEHVWTRDGVIEKLNHQSWDVVIADYSMPQFDGLQALAIVKERDPDLPFILVSGQIGEETAVLAMRSGAHDYVMKHDLGRLAPAVRRELADATVRHARRVAEDNLRSSEALLKSIVDTAADGILVIDGEGIIEFANVAAERMFESKASDLIGRNADCLLGESAAQVSNILATVNSQPTGGTAVIGAGREFEARRANGTLFPVELTIGVMNMDGRVKFACVIRDITERRHTEERIRQLAYYDELTGLPNRILFTKLLEQALQEAGLSDGQVVVLFIDLDRFKLINETLSHDSGDAILCQVAKRVSDVLPRHSTISRFGGDEFVVMMRECTMPADTAQTARQVLDVISQPMQLLGNDYHVTASLGISAFPADGQNVQTLLKNADNAMSRAKDLGKNNYQFYSSEMNQSSFERLVLERLMRRAIEQNEFELYYQPKVNLCTGQVTGMEALLRWMQPGMGMISPVKFIPLAEETGLILPIGAWVLRTACTQAMKWASVSASPLRVAVNLSPRQFVQDDLYATVVNILNETGLDPGLLELEITESLMMNNPDHAAAVLRKLKDIGVRMAIDDFGTGYSSLSYLKRFPIDHVKIDRSFIKDIPGDADDVSITRAIIAMAHGLRLKVIAEGVETKDQVDLLIEHQCEEAQGFLFGRPVPAEEFHSKWVMERAAHLAAPSNTMPGKLIDVPSKGTTGTAIAGLAGR